MALPRTLVSVVRTWVQQAVHGAGHDGCCEWPPRGALAIEGEDGGAGERREIERGAFLGERGLAHNSAEGEELQLSFGDAVCLS